ncbi:MAG: hypothetical protein SGJ11_17240 [Phycisphaerae bacterium]|nr:hypothetical protein [Phycisphaerae bacterium]
MSRSTAGRVPQQPKTRVRQRAVTISLAVSLTGAMALAAPAVQDAPGTGARDDSTPDRRRVAITGDRLSGFILPIAPVSSDLVLAAANAWTWQVDDTQRIQLEGDVRVRLGSYSFSAERAVIWINRLPTAAGEVNQIAIYFDHADEPTQRAGFGAAGDDLLVTASTRGDVLLRVINRSASPAPPSPFVARGQTRLAGYLRTLARQIEDGEARMSPLPRIDVPVMQTDPPPAPGQPAMPRPPTIGPGDAASIRLPPPPTSLPIIRPDGVVMFSAKDIIVDEHDATMDVITVTGSVMIEYDADAPEGPQRLEMRAERGVIFLEDGAIRSLRDGGRTLSPAEITGVYLEGGVVATDGKYTVRGSKVFYDFANNRATIVDAVLRTFARFGRPVTLYARAAEMRQVARDEFQADDASISTSEFFIPHLSVGAERVTITQPPPEMDGPATIKAETITFRAGTVPFFALPGFEGAIEPQPLRSVNVGFRSELGAEIMTRWDLYQLLGMAPPDGVDAVLSAGGYTERGPALGTRFSLSRGAMVGDLDLFGLYDGGGTDRTASGLDVEQDSGFRGIADGEFQTPLSTDVMLQAQLAYISDETFVTSWRRSDFSNRREYETSVYLVSQTENTALTLLAKYGLNGALSNSYLLAGPGYQVDKLPELAYRRYGDDIWSGLSWTQVWSASMMALRPTKGSPGSLGIPRFAFDLPTANSNIADAYFDAGYTDDYVGRVYTRHALSRPFGENNWSIVPFASGQAAGYFMEDFKAYSPDAEEITFSAGGGVRASARFVRIDDKAESRLFDIHRIRHIIEPNSTLWGGWSNIDPGDVPIYDQDVEGANGGAAAQFGVRQQWQTQRGGPGAWESVNFITVDTGVVFNDGGSDFQQEDARNPYVMAQSALPAFYTWRPELSQFGSHLYGMGAWQISDTFTIAGTGTYLLEDRTGVTDPDAILENLAKGSIGLEMRHSTDVSTYLEYRYIAPTSSELLQLGVLYQVGKKYLIAFSPQYDLQAGELRRIQGSLSRTFPDFNLHLNAGYDLIEDQTSVSLSLRIPAETSYSGWSGVPHFGDVR